MPNQGTQDLEWAEFLPPGCPPEGARAPSGEQYYRLVETFPPTDRDFQSQRMLNPGKSFRMDECVARAISLFASCEDCILVMKLPRFRSKLTTVIEIALPPHSGVVLQTGSNRSHFSWWRKKNFNPIGCCSKVVI